jgi:signal transduction histidine kinase
MDSDAAVDRAEQSAARLAAAAGSGRESELIGTFAFHGEALAASWLEDGWNRERLDELVKTVAAALELSPQTARTVLCLSALRARSLLALAPAQAIETVLALFAGFAATPHASLWRRDSGGRLLASHGKNGSETRATREAAERAIASGRVVSGPRVRVHAVPAGPKPTALVYRSSAGAPDTHTFALEAAATLGVLCVLDDAGEAGLDESLVDRASNDRLLVRLGFDLHDGPMQDISALAQDVRLFRSQLTSLLEGNAHRETALGRVDDLEARLIELDRELREIASSLQSPSLSTLTFADALEREAGSFRREGGIELHVRTDGDLEELTSSQRIALLRVIQEALSNVRRHSGATSVTVAVSGGRAELAVVVTDDGRGFDVDKRLPSAARSGRLWLVGMRERVRLLGGRFEIESSGDGSTQVRATIPRWRPLA